jgi:Domain of unknown function (DUF4395)
VSTIIGFPRTVNEVSARLVAAGVVAQAGLWLATRNPLLLLTLTYGFLARVLTGPRLSPLGQLVTKVITPRLPFAEKLVPGPPKRFAQGIGLACASAVSIAWGLGLPLVSVTVISALIVAASLEAFVGLCLGCKIFAVLMKLGVIPADTCEECNNLELRWAQTRAAAGVSS